MSNEDLNRKMEFIIEWQAKFAADMEMMREVHAADSRLVKDGLIGVVDIVGSLARAQERTEGTVNSLAADIKLLTEAQSRTDERLNNLISVVERHISGNGGSHSHP
jgi:hypothetical protein